jgi:hypothetical protein
MVRTTMPGDTINMKAQGQQMKRHGYSPALRTLKIMLVSSRIAMLCITICFVIMLLWYALKWIHWSFDTWLLLFFSFGAITILSILNGAFWMIRAKNQINQTTPDGTDVELLCACIDCLMRPYSSSPPIEMKVKSLIVSVVPNLNEQDWKKIGHRRMRYVYSLVLHNDVNMVLSLLNYIESMGSEEAITYVQKLADGGGLAKTDSTVQQAAARCLTKLQTRLQLGSDSKTLLRTETSQTDTLLRSIGNSGNEEARGILLRPQLNVNNPEQVDEKLE